MTIGEALIYAVTGVAVVFAVLFLLSIIITVFGKLLGSLSSKKVEVAPAAPAAAPEKKPFEGVKLINVDDETAALLMAIVADNTGIAPECLHFEYIKLIEE